MTMRGALFADTGPQPAFRSVGRIGTSSHIWRENSRGWARFGCQAHSAPPEESGAKSTPAHGTAAAPDLSDCIWVALCIQEAPSPGPGEYSVEQTVSVVGGAIPRTPGRGVTQKGLMDGDILELNPSDRLTRAQSPSVALSRSPRGGLVATDAGSAQDIDFYDVQRDGLSTNARTPNVYINAPSKHGDEIGEIDVRGALEYTPKHDLLEPSSRSVDFARVSGRPADHVSLQPAPGDVLILDPQDDLTRRQPPTVDLMHQTGRMDGVAHKAPDGRDYYPDTGAVDPHMASVRLDTGGRPKEKTSDIADVMYDGDDTAVRQSAPAAVFGPMTGREGLKMADGSLTDGDVLELSPDDMVTRASAPHVTFGGAHGHVVPGVHEVDTKDYDPNFEAILPRVPGLLLEKLGRGVSASATEMDVRGALEYTPKHDLLEPSSRSVDFARVSGRPADHVSLQPAPGDVLILDPQDDLTRRQPPTVDLMHQTGRMDGVAHKAPDGRDYYPDTGAVDPHMASVRLDTGGRPKEKTSDIADVMYDGDDTAVRQSAPAAVFGPMTGREGLKMADGSLTDGDVLELSPDDMVTRASAPHVTFGNQIRIREQIPQDTDTCDYEPTLDAVKPRTLAVDFSRLQSREEMEPQPASELDGEAGDYTPAFPDEARVKSVVPFSQQVGREELNLELEPPVDMDYEPIIEFVRPRTGRGILNMGRATGRDLEEPEEDDRDHDPTLPAEAPHVVDFGLQTGRDTISDHDVEPDERNYEPSDTTTKPSPITFSFDQRVGREGPPDEIDETDYDAEPARAATKPSARSVDFKSAPCREDDPNDGGLSGPGTASEKDEAGERPFYNISAARDERGYYDTLLGRWRKVGIEMDRQVGRSSLDLDEETDDRDPLNTDDVAVRRRAVGRVDFHQQVGRESLEIEVEAACDPYEDYEVDLRTTQRSLRGGAQHGGGATLAMSTAGRRDDLGPYDGPAHDLGRGTGRGPGLIFVPVSQSVDVGRYSPDDRTTSTRSSMPSISFTTAHKGDRMRRLQKTGPILSAPDAAVPPEEPAAAGAVDPRCSDFSRTALQEPESMPHKT